MTKSEIEDEIKSLESKLNIKKSSIDNWEKNLTDNKEAHNLAKQLIEKLNNICTQLGNTVGSMSGNYESPDGKTGSQTKIEDINDSISEAITNVQTIVGEIEKKTKEMRIKILELKRDVSFLENEISNLWDAYNAATE